jgi:integrase
MNIRGLYKYAGSKFYWYRWTEDGMRRAVSLQIDDLTEAVAKIRQIQAGALFARWEKAEPVRTPARKLVEQYLRVAQDRSKKPMRPDTARRQGYILYKFLADRGIEHAGEISPGQIDEWLRGLKDEKRSADTLHTYARGLHTFVSYLVKVKLVGGDLLKEFDIPERAAVGRKNWLSSQEVQRVIAESKDPSLTFVLFCGFHAGLRRNEICNARVGWFDLASGVVHIQNDPGSGFVLKDRVNRTVKLSTPFKEFLDVFLRDRDLGDYVIHPDKVQGVWRYRYDFDQTYQTHMRRCGVKCSIHDMRRSFASNLVSAGESIYIVAKWLGDGVEVVERSYGHLAPSAGNINRLTATVAQCLPPVLEP